MDGLDLQNDVKQAKFQNKLKLASDVGATGGGM